MINLEAFKAYSSENNFLGNVIGESTNKEKNITYYCQITIKREKGSKTFKLGTSFKPSPCPKSLPPEYEYIWIQNIYSKNKDNGNTLGKIVMLTVNCNNSLYALNLEEFL